MVRRARGKNARVSSGGWWCAQQSSQPSAAPLYRARFLAGDQRLNNQGFFGVSSQSSAAVGEQSEHGQEPQAPISGGARQVPQISKGSTQTTLLGI